MYAKTSVIYEPRGKAREYAPLAVNLYNGCGHRCEYCYVPSFIHTTQDKFCKPEPRKNIIDKINDDAGRLKLEHNTGPVLLCFTCDPYQPIDEQYQLSRDAIRILHLHNLNVMIITKGGERAERDFDLLTGNDWFGVTLTNIDNKLSLKWEPGACLPEQRIKSLNRAHGKGIKTWVSLEPVLYPEVTLKIIKQTYTFVDIFKVGTLNYHEHARSVDWHKFATEVNDLFVELKCDYYLKNDLSRWL